MGIGDHRQVNLTPPFNYLYLVTESMPSVLNRPAMPLFVITRGVKRGSAAETRLDWQLFIFVCNH